ncbi:retrovirus-related pol polyprotein from transposon TNT 1-94 [Tanacetum coccineum]
MAKFQDGVKRLCLVDDLKMLKITMSNTSSRNKLNPEINDHYNIFTRESQEYELKTEDNAYSPLSKSLPKELVRYLLILGEKGRRIRELTSFVHKRFEFCKNNVGLYAKRVTDIAEAAMVDFGKKLKGRQIQEWNDYYIDYKLMKRKAEKHSRQIEALGIEHIYVLKGFLRMLDNEDSSSEIQEYTKRFGKLKSTYCVIEESNHYVVCWVLRMEEHNHVVGGVERRNGLRNEKVCVPPNATASNAIFEINQLKYQLQRKDDTIRNLETHINITRMLNVGPTTGSLDQQALETEVTQLKDALTSLRIQNDGYKIENANVNPTYLELFDC